MSRHLVAGALGVPMVALALVLSACSGGSPATPLVAQLGNASATTTASAAPSGNGYQQLLAYASCMRSHGVPNFPDPQREGNGISLQITGIDTKSSQFKAAQQACRSLMPQGGPGNGTPPDPTKLGPWAACLRKNGLPNLPDPKIVNNHVQLDLNGTGIDPGSTVTQNALKACRSLAPGGGIGINAGGGK